MPKAPRKEEKAIAPVGNKGDLTSNHTEVIDPSSPEGLRKLVSRVSQLSVQSHSGPLPDPESLMKYGKINFTFPERIFRMAEKEQDHQHAKYSNAFKIQKRGQNRGFFIGCLAIIAALIGSIFGDPVFSSVLAGTTLVGIVAVFVIGRVYFTPQKIQSKKAKPK